MTARIDVDMMAATAERLGLVSPDAQEDEEVCGACDGKGWAIFKSQHEFGVTPNCIQRCDQCELFAGDLEAAEASGLPYTVRSRKTGEPCEATADSPWEAVADGDGSDSDVMQGTWLVHDETGILYIIPADHLGTYDEIIGPDDENSDILMQLWREWGCIIPDGILEGVFTEVSDALKRWSPEDGYYHA